MLYYCALYFHVWGNVVIAYRLHIIVMLSPKQYRLTD